MQRRAPPSPHLLFVFNAANVHQRQALVLAYLRVPAEGRVSEGDQLEVEEVSSGTVHNATVLSFFDGVFEWSHRKALFRQAYHVDLAKIALTLSVPPNHVSLFRLTGRTHTATTASPSVTSPPAWTRDPIFDQVFGTTAATKAEAEAAKARKDDKGLGEFLDNEHMRLELRRDGSVSLWSGQGNYRGLNRLELFKDSGTQYLQALGQRQPPLISADKPVITRNAHYHSAFYRLTFGLPTLEIRLLYVLPRHSRQLWVRVSLVNNGLKHFALTASHPLCSLTHSVNDMAFDHVSRSASQSPQTKPLHKWLLAHGISFSLSLAASHPLQDRLVPWVSRAEVSMTAASETTALYALFSCGAW